jgi:hypothetical protein
MLKNFILEADARKIIYSKQNSEAVIQQLEHFQAQVGDANTVERFISWVATQLRRAEKNNEDIKKLNNNIIQIVTRASKTLSPKRMKEINPFELKTPEQLDLMIDELDPFFARAEAISDDGDLEKIFENDEVLVINVKTFKGSCHLSQGEDKWCTSHGENFFDNHMREGPIFRLYIRKPGVAERNKRCSLSTYNGNTNFWNNDNVRFDPLQENIFSKYTYNKIMDIYNDILEDVQEQLRDDLFDKACELAGEENAEKLEELIGEYSDKYELQKLGPKNVYKKVMDDLGPLGHESREWWDDFDWETGYDYEAIPIYTPYDESEKALNIIKMSLYELGCLNDELKQEFINNRIYPKDPNQLDLFASEQFKRILRKFI